MEFLDQDRGSKLDSLDQDRGSKLVFLHQERGSEMEFSDQDQGSKLEFCGWCSGMDSDASDSPNSPHRLDMWFLSPKQCNHVVSLPEAM